MRAIIPVAGIGTRLRPLTNVMPKVLLNVAGKAMLGYILDKLIEIKIKDVVFITGYKGREIQKYVKENYKELNAVYVEQKEMKGTAHAISLAKKYVKEPVLIIFGDTLFSGSLKPVLETKCDGLIGVCSVEDPRRFGVVELDGKKIKELVEKPEKPRSNLAIIGIYCIKNYKLMFKCIDEIISKDVKTKGEYQFTDALQLMIDKGAALKHFRIDKWLDCGKPETVLSTNRELLRETRKKFKNSVIIQPSHIGENVLIENSVIGPYAVISDSCVVRNSVVRDSVVDVFSIIEDCLLEWALVGRNARFKEEKFVGDFILVKK